MAWEDGDGEGEVCEVKMGRAWMCSSLPRQLVMSTVSALVLCSE